MKTKLSVFIVLTVTILLSMYLFKIAVSSKKYKNNKNDMSNTIQHNSNSTTNQRGAAPTPGDTFKLDSIQLKQLQLEAQSGKIVAMKKLAIYYGVYMADDKLANFWYERAAFAGDHEFQVGIVSKLLSSGSKTDNKRGKQLKQQWNIKDEGEK